MSSFNQRNSDSMSLTEMLLKELDGNHEPSADHNKFREIEKQPTSSNIKLNIMDSELLDGVNIEKNDDSFGDLIEGYARENASNVVEMQRSVPCPVPPPQVMLPPMQMGPSNLPPYAPYPPMNYPQHVINTNSYGAPLPVPPPNFHYSNQQYNPVPDYKKLLTMSVSALPDTTLAIQLKNKKKKKAKKSGAVQEKSGDSANLWSDSPAPPSPSEPFTETSPTSPTPDVSAAKSNSMKHVKEDKLVFKKQTTKIKSPIKTNRELSSEVNNIRKKQDNDIITSTRLDENESLSDLFTKLKTLNDELALLSEKPSTEDSDNEGRDTEDIPSKPKLHSDVFISPKKTNLDTRIKMMISSSDPQNNISISSENTPLAMKNSTSISKRITTLEQGKKMRTTLEQKLKISKGLHQKLSLDKKNNSHIDRKKEEQHKKSTHAPTTPVSEVIPPPTPAALLKPPDMRRDVKTVLLNQKQAIRSDRRPWLDPIIPSDNKTANKTTEQEPALLRPLDKIPSPFLSKELYLYWHKESVKFIKYRERTMMKYINPQMRYIFKDNIVKELNSYARDDSKNITENKDEEDVEKYLERLNEINKKLQELDGCSPQEQNESSDDNDESSGESDDNDKSINNSSGDESSGSSDNDSSKSNKSGESSDNDSSNSINSESDSSDGEADTFIDGANKEKEMKEKSYNDQEKKILKNDESMKPTTEFDGVSNMDEIESSKVDHNTEMSDDLTRKEEEAMETDELKESHVTKVRSMSVGEELEISDGKTSEGRGVKRSREESVQSKADSLIAQVMEYVVRELKGDIREHLERSFIDTHVEEFESSRKRMKLEA